MMNNVCIYIYIYFYHISLQVYKSRINMYIYIYIIKSIICYDVYIKYVYMIWMDGRAWVLFLNMYHIIISKKLCRRACSSNQNASRFNYNNGQWYIAGGQTPLASDSNNSADFSNSS